MHTSTLMNNAYIDYLELCFRDELGKLSGQRGQGCVKSTGKKELGLPEIKLNYILNSLYHWTRYFCKTGNVHV